MIETLTSRALTAVLLLGFLLIPVAAGEKKSPQEGTFPPAEQLPEIKELPDPFMMLSGKRVKTREDWRKRREEIKAMLLYYQFVGGRGHC
jgi:hypothetical protein